MHGFADNPVLLLLRRRQDGLILMLSLGLCVAAGVLLGWWVRPAVGLIAGGISSLLVVPFVMAQGDSAVLSMLVHGGSYDEVRTTKVSSWEILDALTCHTMLSVLRLAPWMALVGVGLTWLTTPAGWERSGALGLACAWLPTLVLAAWAQAGFSQMLAVLSHSSWSSGASLGAVLVSLLPVALPSPWVLLLFMQGHTGRGALLVVVGCFWMAGWSRLFAGLALEQRTPAAFLRQAAPAGRGAPIWPRPWSENPIVVRECAREAGRTPEGVATVLVMMLGFAVALVYVPLLVEVKNLYYWYGALGMLFLLQPTRAASRITGAIAEERDKRTLESLAVTPLGREDFISGWVEIGAFPRLLELAVAAPGLLLCPLPKSLVLLGLFLTAVNTWTGSVLGLSLGLWATSRRHAIGDMAVFVYVLFGATVALALTNGTLWVAGPIVLGLALVGRQQGLRLARYWLS